MISTMEGDHEAELEESKDITVDVQADVPGDKATIVLHPGSTHLHIGLSTDPTPHSIPHLIAYRRKALEDSPVKECTDQSLVLQHCNDITPELEAQRNDGLISIRQSISASRSSLGMANFPIDKEKYLTYNSRVQPVARESDELSLTDLSSQPRCVIGTEVLYLPPDSGYIIYKPFRYGQLNVKRQKTITQDATEGHSMSSVMNMLEDLWTRAIEEYLEIEKKNFKHYHVILLIPDLVDRSALKELVNVLLQRMEFASAFLHQESVCATFSAGLSSACVINVGGEVTHMCCVEEGMSNPDTRVTMRYGGSDITRMFYWLLKQTSLPYTEVAAHSRLDGVLVQELKESICHLDPSIRGVKEHQFSVLSPTPGVLLDYDMKLSDEALQAPMGVFFPSVFCLPDDHTPLMWGQEPLGPDGEDIYDEGHWSAEGCVGTQVRGGSGGVGKMETQGMSVNGGVANGSVQEQELPEATKRLRSVPAGKLLGLDQAVHLSIDCASSTDVKHKLYGSVLIIGGGLAFPGAAAMLQSRLELQLPVLFNRSSQTVEVFSNPRDLESSIVVWKGGAVMSCLDTYQELRIERQEWEFTGVRLLRERAPFIW